MNEEERSQISFDTSEANDAQHVLDRDEILRALKGERNEEPEPESRWGKLKKGIKDYQVVIFVVVLLASYGIVDNKLDADRQEAIREDISGEREILAQSQRNLDGILCLTDRVDFLLDVELEGREISDLTQEELEFLRDSCRDDAGDTNGGEGGEGDAAPEGE